MPLPTDIRELFLAALTVEGLDDFWIRNVRDGPYNPLFKPFREEMGTLVRHLKCRKRESRMHKEVLNIKTDELVKTILKRSQSAEVEDCGLKVRETILRAKAKANNTVQENCPIYPYNGNGSFGHWICFSIKQKRPTDLSISTYMINDIQMVAHTHMSQAILSTRNITVSNKEGLAEGLADLNQKVDKLNAGVTDIKASQHDLKTGQQDLRMDIQSHSKEAPAQSQSP